MQTDYQKHTQNAEISPIVVGMEIDILVMCEILC